MLNEAIFNPDVKTHSRKNSEPLNIEQQATRPSVLTQLSAPFSMIMHRSDNGATSSSFPQVHNISQSLLTTEDFCLRAPRNTHALPLDVLSPIGVVGSMNEDSSHKPALKFDMILRLMDIAAIIYEDSCEVIQRRFPNTRVITTLSNQGLKYMLEENPVDGHQILTIRGTDNLKNSLQDFEYVYTYSQDLGIHVNKGFSDDAKSIFNQLLSGGVVSRTKPITITGHSLGGAIANLLVCYFYKNGFNILPSTTFGQPKVTNTQGLEQYKDIHLTRVVYENDIIPFLPPTTLLSALRGPYQHMGTEVILLEGEFYCYLDAHDAKRKGVNSFWKNTLHERMADHQISLYIKSLEEKQLHAQEVPYEKRNAHDHPSNFLRTVCPCC